MANSSRRPSAFTLVELLVVIAIIGTLVALLLPAVQNARARSRQLTCLNNMKQIATATVSYNSSRGQFPGLTQLVKRKSNQYATVDYNPATYGVSQFVVINSATPPNLNSVYGFSWATLLLSRLERSDIWDQIVQPSVDGSGNAIPVVIPPIGLFVCPSDQDVRSQPDLAGLTYCANSGGWDPRGSGGTLTLSATAGDTSDNGVFFDQAQYDRQSAKSPVMRMSGISDGAGTTLMYAENISKTYDPASPSGPPAFAWLFGSPYPEQQLGFVWVAPTNGTAPQPGNTANDQERISGNSAQLDTFDPTIPRFARPASSHPNGVNVTFCDGHGQFLRDDIDYVVYQQLMTPNGRKCVDPSDHTKYLNSGQSIYMFRAAPPLAEKDYE